jgi:hypothetical protein
MVLQMAGISIVFGRVSILAVRVLWRAGSAEGCCFLPESVEQVVHAECDAERSAVA